MQGSKHSVRNERGSTIAIMSVMLFGMLALAALAIDLASLRSARSEAQRAADAIALAGASAFRDLPNSDPTATQEAQDRALAIARQNMVRSDTINIENLVVTDNPNAYPGGGFVRTVVTEQVTLNIIPALDSHKVRAWVRHEGIGTFFGGLLGVPFGHVQAMATAWASNQGPVVDCLKPFVIPDMWYESDKLTQDVNGDDYMDPITRNPGNVQDGESWKYEPHLGDYYLPYDPSVPVDPLRPQTGYGSPLRSGAGDYPGDVGLPLVLATQTGAGNTSPAPERMGNAFWILDYDPDLNTRDEITSGCAKAAIGDPVPYDNGSRVGQVQQGIRNLVNQDPNAVWNPVTRQVDNSAYSDWTQSPRVVIVGLIDPIYWTTTSRNTQPDPGSVFTNFARIFIEPLPPNGPPENVHARFLGTAPGGAGGPEAGSLVKILQLIE